MKLPSNYIVNINTKYKGKITNLQKIVKSRCKLELRTQLIITSVTQKYTSLTWHKPTTKEIKETVKQHYNLRSNKLKSQH